MTGYDRRTVTNRLTGQEGLQEGRAIKYTVRQLIDGITDKLNKEADVLNLEQERAKLAVEQRRRLERERAIEEGLLLDSNDVLAMWKNIQLQQRQKILNSEISDSLKAELIEELRELNLEDYQNV
jgi:hypothetical protein